MTTPALLALADGSVFTGTSIGVSGERVGEVVFNTAITGYQEILTDPSYARQFLTFTHPHIGNVGINPEDFESSKVWAAGAILRHYGPDVSQWRKRQTLADFFQAQNTVAIAGIDTRQLTRLLRQKGAQNACLMAGEDLDPHQAIAKARAFPGMVGMDLAQEVTVDKPYKWLKTIWNMNQSTDEMNESHLAYHVVAYDYGVKLNCLRLLVAHGCRVTVVPAKMTAEEVLAMKPDGVFLSNGPGDPAACDYAIEATRKLLKANMPIFGICLGHQLLGLASGARTVKMKFGHHGANHPIQSLLNGRVYITSQNHGFAVDELSLPDCLEATHRSLFDKTLQGIRRKDKPAFSLQGHPEASPGPQEMRSVFADFVEMMKQQKS